MNSISKGYTINKFAKSGVIIWMIIAVMLTLNVKSVQSAETALKLKHHQIEISGFAFIPKELAVNIGDTITWINNDIVPHNIIDSNRQKPISADLSSGDTYTFIVKDSMLYKCGLHLSMTGKLSLIDSP